MQEDPKEAAKARLRARLGDAPPAAGPERGSPSAIRGFGESIAQGALFGFGDELLGGVGGAAAEGLVAALRPGDDGFSFGDAYRRNRDDMRGRIDQFREDHGGAALVGELIGGIATGGALAKGGKMAVGAALNQGGRVAGAARRLQGLNATARFAGAGAAGGAAYGAGEADAENVLSGETAIGAMTGGTTGLLAGTLVPAAGRTVSRMAGGTIDALAPIVRRGGSKVGVMQSSRQQAQDRILDRMANEGTTPAVMRNRLQGVGSDGMPLPRAERVSAGEPLTMMELGGTEVLGEAQRIGKTPGPGRNRMNQFVRERQEGQFDRVTNILREGLKTGNRGSAQSIDDIIAARSQVAGPMYEDALNTAGLITDGPVMDLIRSGRIPQRAISTARKIARVETGRDVLQGIENGVLHARDAHYLKLGLDDAVGRASSSAQRTLAGTTKSLAKEFADAMKDSIPGYREAAEEFAGATRMKEALEAGRAAMRRTTTTEDVQRAVREMGASEKEAYLLGAVNDYIEGLANRSGTADMAADFGARSKRAVLDKFRAMAGAGIDVEGVVEQLVRESETTLTRNSVDVAVNSATGPVMAEMLDSAGARFVQALTRGNPIQAVTSLVGDAIQRAQKQGGRVDEELSRILTATGTQLTDELESLIQRELQRQAKTSRTAVGSFVGGGMIGG